MAEEADRLRAALAEGIRHLEKVFVDWESSTESALYSGNPKEIEVLSQAIESLPRLLEKITEVVESLERLGDTSESSRIQSLLIRAQMLLDELKARETSQ